MEFGKSHLFSPTGIQFVTRRTPCAQLGTGLRVNSKSGKLWICSILSRGEALSPCLPVLHRRSNHEREKQSKSSKTTYKKFTFTPSTHEPPSDVSRAVRSAEPSRVGPHPTLVNTGLERQSESQGCTQPLTNMISLDRPPLQENERLSVPEECPGDRILRENC